MAPSYEYKQIYYKFVSLLNITIRVTRISLLLISLYWSYKIQKNLNGSFLNGRVKMQQKRLSNILLGQVLCITVLLQPALVMHPFLLYADATGRQIMLFCSTVLLSSLPLFSPVIIIYSLWKNTSSAPTN
ncbi:hypothetical protein ANCCAN_21272 [Ancylostoma caninum]|uniref:Uncharacterized protein n=1 Tax=Ancylostoma caninum TaxID=29170 RepID=A0A368FQ28_ANCCA|nr:hypothetical protein ANCCAN_21272 [Ancylostoma caninum]